MNESIETYTHEGCEVRIEYDMEPGNPRTDWDNQFTIVARHGRYTLGDPDGEDKLRRAVLNHPRWRHTWVVKDGVWLDLTHLPDLHLVAERVGFILVPLYLYEHGGITIRTGSFGCPWDSGQVGFIYADPRRVCEEHGWQRMSNKRRKQVLTWMDDEVETYDAYLTGQVYGFVVTLGEEEESCWGYYDMDDVRAEANAVASSMAADARRAKQAKLKQLVHNRVPLELREGLTCPQ